MYCNRLIIVVLSTSEVGPILALIAPSPLQKKKHCKRIYFSGAICTVVCPHCENDNEWKQTPCSFIVFEPKIKEIYSYLWWNLSKFHVLQSVTSEVGPILALIAPSPLQRKKHCKHIFSQIIQLIVTHLITIMINLIFIWLKVN
jgi:hypothetical protein